MVMNGNGKWIKKNVLALNRWPSRGWLIKKTFEEKNWDFLTLFMQKKVSPVALPLNSLSRNSILNVRGEIRIFRVIGALVRNCRDVACSNVIKLSQAQLWGGKNHWGIKFLYDSFKSFLHIGARPHEGAAGEAEDIEGQ